MKNKLSITEKFLKRFFDIFFSFIGIIVTLPIIIVSFIIATYETNENGFFLQTRVGKKKNEFKIIKIKTMVSKQKNQTNVTTSEDPRITKSGKFFRKYKIDELPQLINVFLGHMSFVGPRPDVAEMYDDLDKKEEVIFNVKPGITGPATLEFKNEEEILANQDDPEKYNKEVIFPQKIEINKKYIRNYSFMKDIKYILETVFGR